MMDFEKVFFQKWKRIIIFSRDVFYIQGFVRRKEKQCEFSSLTFC